MGRVFSCVFLIVLIFSTRQGDFHSDDFLDSGRKPADPQHPLARVVKCRSSHESSNTLHNSPKARANGPYSALETHKALNDHVRIQHSVAKLLFGDRGFHFADLSDH